MVLGRASDPMEAGVCVSRGEGFQPEVISVEPDDVATHTPVAEGHLVDSNAEMPPGGAGSARPYPDLPACGRTAGPFSSYHPEGRS